ncbi:CAM kinase, CDPK family, putative [Eimeria mitis]|uniref:CAM kinase, CDPK family, putative n=1 Tax=Eimeria mitis TaxID=44415 RepID=U6KI29_9EIME|nr:CAM kinase, CDPK family, putative [Eimeria mitis]CDJ35892.1 CAM kinase, CDPK family, putative [Eimeria mitis]
MGAGQSLHHLRGREAPVAGLSRIRGTQADARTSHSQTTVLSDAAQQPQQNIVRYTSRLMRDAIGDVYSFDFCVLRREDAGKVCRVTCRRSGRKAEALVVRKHLEDPLQLETLKKEIEVWLCLDHPYIARHVKPRAAIYSSIASNRHCALPSEEYRNSALLKTELLEVFEDDRAVYLVSEYCPGGSLYDCLAALQKCPEEVARTWTLQMVRAVGFLQGCGVVHRNLRLESWQLTSEGCFPPLKLYGLSHSTRWHKKEGRLNAACGLLEYTSPDVLLGRYTDACDMWSLGVIVYQLLCGRPPFVGSQQEKIRQILSGDVSLQHLEKAGVSEEAKSFVAQLLTISPHNRLTPQQALEHPWLFGQMLKHQPLPPACIMGLCWFANSTTLRRAAVLMCAYCLNSDQCELVGSVFAGASHSSFGRLTAEDLKRTLQREQPDPLGNEEVEDIFDALDVNKDGEIIFTVFAAAMIGTLVEAEDSVLQKAFTKLDVDGDGKLSLDDCRWAFGATLFGQSLSAALEQEENEDGPLDFDHFSALVREKGKPMHRRVYKTRVTIDRPQSEPHSSEADSNTPKSPAALAGLDGTRVQRERNISRQDSVESREEQRLQGAGGGCATAVDASGVAPPAPLCSPPKQNSSSARPN